MSLPSKELSEGALDALVARERTRIVAPLTEWRTLAMQLRQEGLIRAAAAPPPHTTGYAEAEPGAPSRRGWRRAARWTRRTVVGAALLGGGIVIGRGMTLGSELVPAVSDAVRSAVHDSLSSVRVSAGSKGISVAVTSKGFRTPAEAQAVLARAQADYQRAAAYLAATDTLAPRATNPELYRDRLAALDEMMAATLSALNEAPADPLLNQYYLSTVGARDATLQQLRHAAPASGAQLVRF